MSVNDPHMEFNSLVTRFLSGELSPEELRHFREIIAGNQDLKDRLNEYQKVWDSMEGVAVQHSYNLDSEWSAMRSLIPGLANVPKEEEIEDQGSKSMRSLLFYTYRIAAVLMVGLVFAFAWIYATRLAGTEQQVATTGPIEVYLEDGSHVLLNRDSKIRYRKQFKGSEREVRLSGEAWFDVARDTLRPFVIDAGTALVEVLGTSFNVNAYKENSTVEITVESGMVAVTAKQDQDEQIILRAGNSGTYNNRNRELVLVTTSDPNNLSWKTRNLYFENSPLEEVAKLISRVYNTHLVIRNPELSSCPITVTFSDQSLESVLNVLELTLDLEISQTGNSIVLDGTGCVE
jgi:transmembrane sensor